MATSTHPDIIEFMTLYEQVQTATKGSRERIPFLYKNDQKFAELCRQIDRRVFFLKNRIRDSGDTVLKNVDQRFIAKWRHYENELDEYIGCLTTRDLFVSMKLIDENDVSLETSASNEYENLKEEAEEESNAIELQLELGSWERVNRSTVDEEIIDKVYLGELALERLFKSLSLNITDALYRQKMLTIVHIPTHASIPKSENSITLSEALNEAHRAFILGAPLAAIALCRTVSEIIIRDHYKIGDQDSKFTQRFQDAKKDLVARTKGADEELVQLIKYASNIMHGRKADDRISKEFGIEALPSDLGTINRVAFRWLEKLVKLIEATPKR